MKAILEFVFADIELGSRDFLEPGQVI